MPPAKVLYIEDEHELQTLMKMRLLSKGYEVIQAFDGEDGLAKARAEKPDIILLDLSMPKMDGYSVCAEIKNDPDPANAHHRHIGFCRQGPSRKMRVNGRRGHAL